MVAVDRKFEFELVSPERLVLSEPVDMAVIPGSEGDFGVLAGHSLVISTLRPGVIEVWQGEQVTSRLFRRRRFRRGDGYALHRAGR